MDQIVTAIVAALPAIAAATATSVVKDAYAGLKALVRRKWGEKGDVSKSLDALEVDPASEPLAQDFAKHAERSELQEDPDIVEAVRRLKAALEDMRAPAAASASYTQHGGTQIGVGAMAENKGTINIRR